jgi:hypothetical protein
VSATRFCRDKGVRMTTRKCWWRLQNGILAINPSTSTVVLYRGHLLDLEAHNARYGAPIDSNRDALALIGKGFFGRITITIMTSRQG